MTAQLLSAFAYSSVLTRHSETAMSDVHAIILTLNEERHLARCVHSIAAHCASITVVTAAHLTGPSKLRSRWVRQSLSIHG